MNSTAASSRPAPPVSDEALVVRMERVLQEARAAIYEQPGPAVAALTAVLVELEAARDGETAGRALEVGRARAWELLAIGQRVLGNYEAGLRASDEAKHRYERLRDEAGVAKSCLLAGNLHWALGAFEPALRLYEQALTVRRRLGDRRGEAGALGSLGVVLDELGRLDEARRCYKESLAISRELGDRMFEGRTLNNLGEAFKAGGYATLPGRSYHNFWWVSHDDHGVYTARGIHGQAIYIDSKAEMVIALRVASPRRQRKSRPDLAARLPRGGGASHGALGVAEEGTIPAIALTGLWM